MGVRRETWAESLGAAVAETSADQKGGEDEEEDHRGEVLEGDPDYA